MKPLLLALLLATPVAAHDAARDTPELSAAQGIPLPLPLGGAFSLVDQFGRTRTEADPDRQLQLMFFGYVACESICTVALPQMAGIAQRLRNRGIALRPVMITVDPVRDTPAAMARVLNAMDADFVGLTGSDTALQSAYDAFAVDTTVVFNDPSGAPAVYAHGSLLYLLDGQGQFLTIIPPILSDDRVEEIIAAFAMQQGLR